MLGLRGIEESLRGRPPLEVQRSVHPLVEAGVECLAPPGVEK